MSSNTHHSCFEPCTPFSPLASLQRFCYRSLRACRRFPRTMPKQSFRSYNDLEETPADAREKHKRTHGMLLSPALRVILHKSRCLWPLVCVGCSFMVVFQEDSWGSSIACYSAPKMNNIRYQKYLGIQENWRLREISNFNPRSAKQCGRMHAS